MEFYHRIKLWYWWNFTINHNEFHHSLSSMYIYFNGKHLTQLEIQNITTARRQLAHLLDSNQHVPTNLIISARI